MGYNISNHLRPERFKMPSLSRKNIEDILAEEQEQQVFDSSSYELSDDEIDMFESIWERDADEAIYGKDWLALTSPDDEITWEHPFATEWDDPEWPDWEHPFQD